MKLGTFVSKTSMQNPTLVEFTKENFPGIICTGTQLFWPVVQPTITSQYNFTNYLDTESKIHLDMVTSLLWPHPYGTPDWFWTLSMTQRLEEITKWITAICNLQEWSYLVIGNELFDNASGTTELSTYGHTVQELATAIKLVHKLSPKTQILLNQHHWSPIVFYQVKRLIKTLKEDYNIRKPYDSIGWQAHHWESAGWRVSYTYQCINTLKTMRDYLNRQELDFWITEADVGVRKSASEWVAPGQNSADVMARQAVWWKELAKLAKVMKAKQFVIWGISDNPPDCWMSDWYPTLYTTDYVAKPGLQEVLNII